MIFGGRGASLSAESSRLFDLDLAKLFLLFGSFLVSCLPELEPLEAGTTNGVIHEPWDSEGAR